MALFTKKELLEKGRKIVEKENIRNFSKKDASTILKESTATVLKSDNFDIFLSHSFLDADIILGLKEEIKEMGFSVYIDWIEDSHLDRSKVNKETAELLKKRLKQCKCLFYATSENSAYSKWMPWECGYFDGYRGLVAICPIVEQEGKSEYKGQEYLSLYPYIHKDKPKNKIADTLWVHENNIKYVNFKSWLDGKLPEERN